jgi:type II secretory pathway component PulK
MRRKTLSATRSRLQRPRPLRRAQRGIALLVAILLVAIGTIIAAAVAYENAMTARRGTATYAFDEALLISEGAEALAAYGLKQLYQSDPTHTYPGQGWDKPVGPFEVVPGVMLQASLEDLQGRFNLNNLVRGDGTPDPTNVAAFTKLLELVGLETKWTGLIIDWIDVDIVPQNPDGAEDSVYMGQTPPYRTPNRYITSTSELLALPGFGRDRYLAIAPYVTALPNGYKINVCTAKDKVLDAFLPAGQTEYSASANADQLVKTRQATTGCFPALRTYLQSLGTKAGTGAASGGSQFQENSSFFRLTSFITIGGAEFNLYSLMYLDSTGSVRPLQRSFTPD